MTRAGFSVGALKLGSYKFIGERHADTAEAEMRAVEKKYPSGARPVVLGT